MKINELIRITNKGYPDGMIAEHWNFEHKIPAPNSSGDTLALFIVRELADTFDEESSDEEQLETATQALNKAQRELEDVCNALYLERQTLK